MHYNVQRIFSSKKIENGIKRPLPGPTMWFLRSYALTRTEKTGGLCNLDALYLSEKEIANFFKNCLPN